MKYIKQYESIKINLDEYITLKQNASYTIFFNDFIKTHIAQIIRIVGDHFYIKFIDKNLTSNMINSVKNIVFHITDIDLHSKSLEEIETKLQANKYNL